MTRRSSGLKPHPEALTPAARTLENFPLDGFEPGVGQF
jgi:hypothetical protein